MDKKKLLLLPWSLGHDESSWPAVTQVWIRLKGIPYHFWTSDILLSIAGSIGKPLRLDDTTVLQRMLSYNRVLLNLDVAKSSPRSLTVELEGDEIVEVQVQYENIPCSECLSAGHLSINCPFRVKPSLLTTPVQAALLNTPTTSAISGTVLEPKASAKGSQPPVAILVLEVSGSLAFVLPASAAVPYSSGKTLHSSYPNCSPILPPSTNSAHSLGLNSANDLQHDSPIMALPTDLVYEIFEKISAPILDCSNPFPFWSTVLLQNQPPLLSNPRILSMPNLILKKQS
ncbi:hypothetical protein AAC387_Pa05g1774 [Persea americana]